MTIIFVFKIKKWVLLYCMVSVEWVIVMNVLNLNFMMYKCEKKYEHR